MMIIELVYYSFLGEVFAMVYIDRHILLCKNVPTMSIETSEIFFSLDPKDFRLCIIWVISVVNINILSFDPMFSNSWMRPWMQGLRMRELLWKIIKLLKLEYESHTIIEFRPLS